MPLPQQDEFGVRMVSTNSFNRSGVSMPLPQQDEFGVCIRGMERNNLQIVSMPLPQQDEFGVKRLCEWCLPIRCLNAASAAR